MSATGQAAITRHVGGIKESIQKEATTVPIINIPSQRRHCLPPAYMNYLLDIVGDRIIDIQESFQQYSTNSRMNLRHVAKALEELRYEEFLGLNIVLNLIVC